jgi:hypothetical protein
MAENFNSFSDESAKNIESIRSSMLSIQDSARVFDKALKNAGNRTADYRKEFNRILISSRAFNETQEKAKTSSKGIADALKQQNIQFSVIKNLNNQIDTLYLKASKSTGSTKYNLERQANALSAARDNAVELSKEYGNLAEDSSKLDKSTAFFSGLSNIAKDIPGLRQLSGPFEAAAKASREAVLSNVKLSGLKEDMLRTGKGLTAQKIKELGLEKEAAGLTGSTAAKKLRDAGVTVTPQSQLVAGLQGGITSAVSSIKDIFSSGGWIGLLIKGIQMLVDVMFEADKQITDISKNFIISKEQAAQVRDRFDEIAKSAGRFTLLQEGNQILRKEEIESNFKINELLGTKINLTKDQGIEGIKLLNQFANISKFLNLSNEEQQGLLDISAATGEEIDDIQLSILGTVKLRGYESKLLLNESKILKDILKLSNANKLTIKGGAEGLANAAFAAAKLGSNLKTVEKVSESLLQFEDSITSEIQAELLLGKEFNFEIARSAALFGDLETVANEVNKQIGSAAEFSKMNVIQQSALAKTFGLQRDELADILVQHENLNKLKDVYNIRAKDEIENLKTNGKISEAVYNSIKQNKGTTSDYFKVLQEVIPNQQQLIKDLGEQSFLALRNQSAQDKFNEALERAKETFSTFVTGNYLDRLADLIVKLIKTFGDSEGIAKDEIAQQLGANPGEIEDTSPIKEADSIPEFLLKSAYRKTKIGEENTISEIRPLGFLDPISERLGDYFKVSYMENKKGEVIDWSLFANGIDEMNKNLKELNENTKKEKTITMNVDGASIGTAMVKANSKMGS